jgi:hypothetical protein
MTIEQAILAAMPGTGREIADKVSAMGIPQAEMVTPNVVYAVMGRNNKLVKRMMVGGADGKLRQYFAPR